ncbi:MAG TPA: alanine--tRNA ligase-related protein [Candidatus Limnocylindrales bacterium]|nr:alanine--tRNA ligase-related protein [Candidatus Limnocylindrales bacterium]
MLTERLYYNDSSLLEFDATVTAVEEQGDQALVSLDRSAFYPTSGGQNFDTGEIFGTANGSRVRVIDVQEQTGDILHLIDCPPGWLRPGVPVRGEVDADRRRDHTQQHSGQHVLSAAFEKLYNFATVSFHMGDDLCTIDLAADAIHAKQLEAAERLANEIIAEDRPVEIRFATPEDARGMGVRKIPPAVREKLRLIDIRDFDLNACGGTHVHSTGQIGAILLRKTEKVKQGVRVEFVCGLRAVSTARHDFRTLTDAAAAFSTHLWEVPEQARKSLDEIRSAQKAQHRLLEEVAELQAANLLRTADEKPIASGQKLVIQFFADRDLAFIKMLAQKLIRLDKATVLLACGGAQPSLVFAQTPGLPNDMGALMKDTLQKLGTRGGGNRDMAQGGAPDADRAEHALSEAASTIG